MGTHSHLPLRPYQDLAVDEALCRRSLLLALVQGAGKTRTVIETIRILAEEGSVQGGAIFCPSSLKFQWRDAELAKWDDANHAIVIDGTKKKRTQQYEEAHNYRYTILNYDALVHDWDLIKQYLPIDFIVADEVTFIKGLNAKRSKRLKMLGHYARYRYGLSGQPIENRPEELYSIMQFVDPTVLGDPEHFDRTFLVRTPWGKTVGHRNLPLLRQTLGDAMFRRSRADIAEYLPQRIETDIPVHMTGQQAKLYDHIREDLCDTIDQAMAGGVSGFDVESHYGGGGNADNNKLKGLVMARITAMRLLCSHPQLLSASAQDYDDPKTASGSAYAAEMAAAGLLDHLPDSSAKLDALVAQLKMIFEEEPESKVVIYSVFKSMVRMIQEEARDLGLGCVSMTGSTTPKNRQQAIENFNTNPGVKVFVSSDAGAYGVNLDRGTHLISYDFPWSAGTLGQRVARIDRTSTVAPTILISYLYGFGTIDHYQKMMLEQKQAIGDAWVDGRNIDAKGGLELSLSSLRDFMETPLISN